MKKRLPLGSKLTAGLWGFSEATFFFIVPDVYLSYAAINGFRNTLLLYIHTVVAAILGGTLMYFWGIFFPENAFLFLDYIPAISQHTIQSAEQLLYNGILSGMIYGSVSGIPYKIFAVYAGKMAVSLPLFIAYSFIARSLRFLIVICISVLVYNILMKNLTVRIKILINTLFWSGFYIWYFSVAGT